MARLQRTLHGSENGCYTFGATVSGSRGGLTLFSVTLRVNAPPAVSFANLNAAIDVLVSVPAARTVSLPGD